VSGAPSPRTQISGNGTDLFCDSKSVITGAINIVNAVSVQCGNLLPGDNEGTP
jgi:carbonic anhydrase/acetyltransferase-like protein (isoleucine patch superfamily)